MCGIAGYYGTRQLSPRQIDACLSLMGRRGPDGQDWIERRIGEERWGYLLHSRLRIIDLDPRANQPFRRGQGHLCFNGEIYNYLELRQDLAQLGEAFTTESDTEVLSALLARYHLDKLDSCEGMWAFAWLDQEGLVLCRDRFGEKPLYLFEDETGIYFGSEPKFIFALLGRRLPINIDHLYRYLVNGYKSLYKQRQTFFLGLQELKPGTWLQLDPTGRRQSQPYWQPKFDQYQETLSFEEAVSAAQAALIDSVRLRLRADVPIAFCLSGGVDSNALIAIASRKLNYQVHGFTIMNTDTRYEERDLVETTVQELGLKHTEIPIDHRDFLPNLRRLIRYHDAPVCTITYYAQWQLMAAVAQAGYRVSVSGTGADELFSGYFDHQNFYLQGLQGDPAAQAQARENWRRVVAPIVRNPVLQDPDAFIKEPTRRDHIYLDADTFAGFLKTPWQEPFQEESYSTVVLRNRMNNELFHESVPPILHEDDLNAMYFSIENRSPFLDRPLFELCQSIPTRHLIQDAKAKAVLREAVRGLAPDAVVDNPRKVGFNVPIFDYLNVQDPEVCDQLLADSPIFDHVHRQPIEQMIRQPHLPNSQSKFLFYFLNAKIFLEEFSGAAVS
jgi:asparagine synthase (glutamine-hydrolysing)